MLIVVSLYVSITTANAENKRNRQIKKSEFDVPVKQRSAQQKASCIRFWRNKSKFSIQSVNGGEKLFFDAKAYWKGEQVGGKRASRTLL